MKVYTIKYYFKSNRGQLVPINYRSNLTSFLHNKILKNDPEIHNDVSLYSISDLFNSTKTVDNKLEFNNGAIWLIRTPSVEVFKTIYLTSKNVISSDFGFGLTLDDVSYSVDDFQDKIYDISLNTSPVFLGNNRDSEVRDHITYKHGIELTSTHLKRILKNKASKLGFNLNDKDFDLYFDENKNINVKPVKYNNILNFTTKGSLKFRGDGEVLSLIYGLGLGLSTGCGFGFCFNIKL